MNLVADYREAQSISRGPTWTVVEFLFRLAFFGGAPFLIVLVAMLFPVRGAIIDVAVALVIFALGDRARRWTSRSRVLSYLCDEALAFEGYYRSRAPKPFLYYLCYPMLLPYWLINREARREFLIFRGYNLGGFLVLLGTLVWQYATRFRPELGFREFLPQVWITLLVEMLLALSLLMPIATTFVSYHRKGQRWRLDILLAVGLMSSSAAVVQVTNRRDPVVSWATSERVRLRTKANARRAHQALLAAARAARTTLLVTQSIDGDGKVMGAPLDAARLALQKYYKSDEVLAFDLWVSPRKRPRAIVLYFEARHARRPIWVAIDGFGKEIRSPDRLPRGAFAAMRAASDGIEDLLENWPDPPLLDFVDVP